MADSRVRADVNLTRVVKFLQQRIKNSSGLDGLGQLKFPQQGIKNLSGVKELGQWTHESVEWLHTKKLDGVIFKMDFENAYDKVKKWYFLQ